MGPEHISTLYSRAALGSYLARSGQLVEAEEHLRATVEALEALRGPADPTTLRSLAGLSIVASNGIIHDWMLEALELDPLFDEAAEDFFPGS